MPADMTSMDAVLKDYTPEQVALVDACKPKPPIERKVTNHLPRRINQKDPHDE